MEMHKGRRFFKNIPARVFFLGLLILWFCGCASSSAVTPAKGNISGIAVVPAGKTGLFTNPPADALMLNEGVSWLGLSDEQADYAKARETFAALTKNYPKSRWRPLAETFIRLIDNIQTLQEQRLSEQALSDRIKKDIQTLNNKLLTERAGLLQENEKLKKDIDLLKQLEVQLDKREKMLR